MIEKKVVNSFIIEITQEGVILSIYSMGYNRTIKLNDVVISVSKSRSIPNIGTRGRVIHISEPYQNGSKSDVIDCLFSAVESIDTVRGLVISMKIEELELEKDAEQAFLRRQIVDLNNKLEHRAETYLESSSIPDLYFASIDVLDFTSARINNFFREAGIKTIGDIINFDLKKAPKFRNFGKKSVLEFKEIVEYLRERLENSKK